MLEQLAESAGLAIDHWRLIGKTAKASHVGVSHRDRRFFGCCG
jgi:hypothetical protein